MNNRVFILGAAVLFSTGSLAAEGPATSPPSDRVLAELVARHFGDARPASDAGAKIPPFRLADFNGDGEQDIVIPFSDAESDKRGSGCYGMGIVNSYLSAPERQSAFHIYNCYKEYTVETHSFIPVKLGGTVSQLPLGSPRPCVRIILKYDDRDFLCWRSDAYLSMASTPRN